MGREKVRWLTCQLDDTKGSVLDMLNVKVRLIGAEDVGTRQSGKTWRDSVRKT